MQKLLRTESGYMLSDLTDVEVAKYNLLPEDIKMFLNRFNMKDIATVLRKGNNFQVFFSDIRLSDNDLVDLSTVDSFNDLVFDNGKLRIDCHK